MLLEVQSSVVRQGLAGLALALFGGAAVQAQQLVISGNTVAISEFQSAMFADASHLQHVPVGQSRSSTFKVSNVAATGDLIIGSATLGGPNPGDFSVQLAATTIPPGGSTDLTVTFTPTTQEQKLAAVTVTSNDLDDNSHSFTVVGSGVAAAPPATQLKVSWGKKAPTLKYNKRFGLHMFSGQVIVQNEGPNAANTVGVFIFGTKEPGFIRFGDTDNTELLAYWPVKAIKGVSSKGKPGSRKSKATLPMATAGNPADYRYLTAIVMDFDFGELNPSDNNSPVTIGNF